MKSNYRSGKSIAGQYILPVINFLRMDILTKTERHH